MSRFADEPIILAKKGDPGLSPEEQEALLPKIPAWKVVDENGVQKLVREYRSSEYDYLMTLTQKLCRMAEQVNHHPSMLLEWGKLTVSWWTHTSDGLHRNDFIMAARCDRAAMLVHAL